MSKTSDPAKATSVGINIEGTAASADPAACKQIADDLVRILDACDRARLDNATVVAIVASYSNAAEPCPGVTGPSISGCTITHPAPA